MIGATLAEGVAQTVARGKKPVAKKKPNLSELVDELGQLRAEMADMAERQSEIEAAIRASRKKRIEGELFTVVVKRYSQWRISQQMLVDKIAILMKSAAKAESWVVKHKSRIPVVSIEVNAKNKVS